VNKKVRLRQIPSVDFLLKSFKDDGANRDVLVKILQQEINQVRQAVLNREIPENLELTSLIRHRVDNKINLLKTGSMKKVINGTGIILHTGLGRAAAGEKFFEEAKRTLSGYVNLELDMESGNRGQRLDHVTEYLRLLSGAEEALVVNNNAAALILALNTSAENKEVIVSRGELIEIGGSFRLPEIIAKSGAHIHEVGTTNRTHLQDYERSINENTGAILLANTSNYTIKGFTTKPQKQEIIALASKYDIPVLMDLGSGDFLSENSDYAVEKNLSFDALCFSGDKLLGGPQAGIILGNHRVQAMKKNPLYRALRCDKFTLFSLQWNLKNRIFGRNEDIKFDELLNRNDEALVRLAEELFQCLEGKIVKDFGMQLIKTEAEVGSGSRPGEKLLSRGVVFHQGNAEKIAALFRTSATPVVGRIEKDNFILDLKAIDSEEIPLLTVQIEKVYRRIYQSKTS